METVDKSLGAKGYVKKNGVQRIFRAVKVFGVIA